MRKIITFLLVCLSAFPATPQIRGRHRSVWAGAPAAYSVTDNFAYSNGTLGNSVGTTNWANCSESGYGNLYVTSNVVNAHFIFDYGQCARLQTSLHTFAANQAMKFTVSVYGSSASAKACGGVRANPAVSGNNQTGYYLCIYDGGVSGGSHTVKVELYNPANAGISTLATTSITVTTGDQFEIAISGTSITVTQNSTNIPALAVTDATLSSGQPLIHILGGGDPPGSPGITSITAREL